MKKEGEEERKRGRKKEIQKEKENEKNERRKPGEIDKIKKTIDLFIPQFPLFHLLPAPTLNFRSRTRN